MDGCMYVHIHVPCSDLLLVVGECSPLGHILHTSSLGKVACFYS